MRLHDAKKYLTGCGTFVVDLYYVHMNLLSHTVSSRLQIGTLDCEYSKSFFNKDFDLCVLRNPLPCGSIQKLLLSKKLPSENIAILQIDIEGYEYILLEGFLKSTQSSRELPPIIHFEHKVMKHQDIKFPLVDSKSRLGVVKDLLLSNGYKLHDEGEDYLAVKVD